MSTKPTSGVQCDCLKCAFLKVIEERFPDGMDNEQAADALEALATVTGNILSWGDEDDDDEVLDGFRDLVEEHRDSNRLQCEGNSGRLN